MIQRLVILGILQEQPASGYGIKKYIRTRVGPFSGLDTQSIYYPLRQLDRDGCIRKKKTSTRAHPLKSVYMITARGRKEFFTQCRQAFVSQARPFMEFDLALHFLPVLSGLELQPLLRLRLRFLTKVIQWLSSQQQEPTAPQDALILEHHARLACAEKDFIQQMVCLLREGCLCRKPSGARRITAR